MTFDELFNSLPHDGWLKKDEAALLLKAAKTTTGPILEVGCYKGRSTVLLASLNRPVICVDPFKDFNTTDMSGVEGERLFTEAVTSRNLMNVYLYKTKIENFQINYPNRLHKEVGFAYLDGDHTYGGTMNQIQIAFSAGAESVCIHDYDDKRDGLKIKQAVEDSNLEIIERATEMVWCIREGTGAQ